jgi:AcrR family transcriptional regulator
MAPRVDAQRNIDALLAAAKVEFAEKGVDVNVRAIAERAGVGTATLYRHFPLRSDLISAVMRSEIDAVVAEAQGLAAAYGPDEALERFVLRYTKFVATKRGLAAALHSGDPAFAALPVYFEGQVGPILASLLHDAEGAGLIRADVDPIELLGAIANLSIPSPVTGDPGRAFTMVNLLLDGLRYRALAPTG